MTALPCLHPVIQGNIDVTAIGDGLGDGALITQETGPPSTYSIILSATCEICAVKLLFDGPIGIAVGPGTAPMVSVDGTLLYISAHTGDRDPGERGRSTTVRLRRHPK